jgi:serine/threonine-protein kinase
VDAIDAAAADARIGSLVDKYVIVRLVGRGGMGAVYEARHAHLERRFAIKFLLPELTAAPAIVQRFENEAKAAAKLEHPNLAAVTDVGRAGDGSPYLVMEFLEGEDCARLLRRLGPLPAPRAADIVLQASRGLAVAHRARIVHRDLKPENLFVTDAGDGCDLVKVLDFGIAKLRTPDANVSTGTGTTLGTAFYMSPEQARGAAEVDERSDVWSLGVVLYELLSGRRPFAGATFLEVVHHILGTEPPALASLRPHLPPRLVAVVERALVKDPARRLASMAALGDALVPLAGRATVPAMREAGPGEPTLPTPVTGVSGPGSGPTNARTEVPGPRRGRRGRAAAGIGVAVVAAGATAAFALLRVPPGRDLGAMRETSPQSPQSSGGAGATVAPAAPAAPPPVPAMRPPASLDPAPSIPSAAEQFEQGSNLPIPADSAPGRRRVARRAGTAAADAAAPEPAPIEERNPRQLEIETNNPY